MRNWQSSKVLGGITLALILGDVAGVYLVKHRLSQRPDMQPMVVIPASVAVTNAARDFRLSMLGPARSSAPAAAAAPAIAASAERLAIRPVPPAEVISDSPAVAVYAPVAKPVPAPATRLRASVSDQAAAAQPVKHSRLSFSAAFARDISAARAVTRPSAPSSFSRQQLAPDFAVAGAAVQSSLASDNPVTAAETLNLPMPAFGGNDVPAADQPAPSAAPSPSQPVQLELPALESPSDAVPAA